MILVITSLIFFMMVNPAMASNINPMSVKHQVKGKDIYVECVISNFTFSKKDHKKINQNGFGYMQLYLNNQKIDNIYTAAFIVKGLPAGKHQIKLELVHNDGTPYNIQKEFDVTI
ncbi:hypothetical protein P9E76_09700 [Schinkia azotoformans]|nr:methylenetetrahydromethanopterin dehydrogenase [Schinkia azotoformans]MEC1640832.1 hypothetical protein [Schinkia azotoformans]MEC1721060.1 hypothetical protein [Schinkia azotoformans]MEC1945318.1 hypothetical protein [Schinkia azotoformans]MED4352988.1 hypothetical protein [Schinkia azotoformans]MED4412311.1 hypothetical protein [Schinkia azotoformans]